MPEKPKCPLIGQNGNIFNLNGRKELHEQFYVMGRREKIIA